MKEKKIKAVVSVNENWIEAEHFISNVHPASLPNLVGPEHMKPSIARISEMENTMGMFSLYLVLKRTVSGS
ncbi:MAG: hypothetical protein HC906_07185 [Bacteroidales bacterium]|nr:hypothetical protein [Bacteroidales bacterium]